MSFSCFWITEKEQKDNLSTGKVMLRGMDLESLVSYSSLSGCSPGTCPPTPVLFLTVGMQSGYLFPPPLLSYSSLNALGYLAPHSCLAPHCLDAVWAPVPQLHHNIAFTEVCVWGVVANDRARKMKALMTKPHD